MLRIKRKTIYESLGLILIKVCLDLVYIFFICDDYGYYLHFKLVFDLFRYIESWFMYLILVALTPRKKTVTAFFLLMQLVVTIAPMITMYGLYNHSSAFMYLICAAHLLQCVLCKVIRGRVLFARLKPEQGRAINRCIILSITGVVVALTFIKYGIPSLRALNFSDVYEVRAQRKLTGVLGYFVPWFFSAILPFVIIKCINKKEKIKLVLFLAIAVYLYLVYAQKSWLLVTFFVMAVYVATKLDLFVKGCCFGIPLLVGCITLLYKITGVGIVLPSLFVRRIFFVPANIKFGYYRFFQENPKLFFSEGQIGNLLGLESPYNTRITYVIGEMLGESGSSCNTGYMADGYANLGVAGIFLMSVILVLILKVVDLVAKEENFVASFSMLSYLLFSLNDGALLTRLLTGGMFLIILMLIMESKGKGTSTELSDMAHPERKEKYSVGFD